MKNIEVLLRERVGQLGRCGDVVRVASGYARNFLYPRRLAVPATEENKRMLARRAQRMAVADAAMMADIEKKVAALSALSLETTEKADENGHLYGSVSSARAAEILTAAGYPCEERDVRLEKPIKMVGSHEIPINVYLETFAAFTLTVKAPE